MADARLDSAQMQTSALPASIGGDDAHLWHAEALHRANNLLQLGRAAALLQQQQGEPIDDLLTALARLEAVYRELDVTPSSACVAALLAALATALVDLFGPLAGGVTLRVHASPMILPASSRRAIILIASELTINALRHAFGGHGGAIDVALEPCAPFHCKLTVADDGCGLGDDQTHGGGSDLVAAMTQTLGGALRAISQPSSGSLVELGSQSTPLAQTPTCREREHEQNDRRTSPMLRQCRCVRNLSQRLKD